MNLEDIALKLSKHLIGEITFPTAKCDHCDMGSGPGSIRGRRGKLHWTSELAATFSLSIHIGSILDHRHVGLKFYLSFRNKSLFGNIHVL
jgi:hypothetical protein